MWIYLKKAQQYTQQAHFKNAHHFDFNLPSGHIEDAFKMCPSFWSRFDLWAHWGHFQKIPLGFFHKFAQNTSKLYLSHSLRVLSKNTPKYVLNVPTGFILMYSKKTLNGVQFYQKLSMNSLNIWLSILRTYLGAFFERTLNEWLRYNVDTFWANLWKKPKGIFWKCP